jgi:hypothetical protein
VLARSIDDAPVELGIEVAGARVVDEDVLGRLEIGVLLQEHVGAAGVGLADGWEGDRYALVELGDSSRGLLWYALWEDGAVRDRFAAGLEGALQRFGSPAALERVEVGGRPATLLRVGSLRGVTSEARVTDAP